MHAHRLNHTRAHMRTTHECFFHRVGLSRPTDVITCDRYTKWQRLLTNALRDSGRMCSATVDVACAATRPCTSLMRITVDDLCPATADDNCNGLRVLYAQPALARCDAAVVTLALCNATTIAPRLRSTVYRACGAAMGC